MRKIIFLSLVLYSFLGCSNSLKKQDNSSPNSNALIEEIGQKDVRTQKIDKVLDKFFSSGPLGGTALVSQGGKMVYKKAFGKSNLELDIDMDVSHKFRIASNTKQFTACAILKLEEQGKLSISDDLTKYIKDYPTQGNKITIEHLLTHTSGIPDFSSYEGFSQIENNDYTTLEFIDIFKNYPLTGKPGEQYQYSNTGYFILGYIIEKVSGQSYGEFLANTIFQPLGMKNTFFDYPEKNIEYKTFGYTQQSAKEFVPSKKISMSIPFAAGGLVSTVDDLALWYNALKKNKVINQDNLKKAHSPYKLNKGKYTRYGYGWDIGTVSGTSLIAHGGAISGYYSALVYLPTEDVLAVVLTNCNWIDPSFFDLATKIASVAIDKAYYEFPSLSQEVLEPYEAVYETSLSDKLSITIEGGKPYFTLDKGQKRLINFIEKDVFYSESNFTTLKFLRDEKDRINSIVSTRAIPIIFNRTNESLPKKSVFLAIQSKVNEDVNKVIEYYISLKISSYEEYDFLNSEDLNRFGYALLAQNRFEDAIKIFELLVSEFSKEFNPYDSLGEAYLMNNQLALAKKNYKKSFELNPNNKNAKEMIMKINQRLKP